MPAMMPRHWVALLLLLAVVGTGAQSTSDVSTLSGLTTPGDADVSDDADIDAVACPGFPPSPAHARATFEIEDCKDLAAGEACDADCLDENDDGFVTATCKADGTFEVTGNCTPAKEGEVLAGKRCRRRPKAAGARFRCTDRSDGAVCTGTCRRRYLPRGNLDSTCAVPTWGAVTGSCKRVCRGKYKQPDNGAFDCGTYVAGETCDGTCNAGFGPDPTLGGPQLPCNARARWGAPTGACVPVCLRANLPTAPANSAWPGTGCDNVNSGGTCTAQCATNYAGTVTSTCTSGVWSAPTGTCILQVCLAANLPSAPANSAWPASGCDNVPAGATCTAPCAAGYSGTVTSTCNSGSPSPSWGAVSGTCIQQCTTAPGAQSNVTFTSCANKPDGNVCSGSCDSGTSPRPNAAPTATCNAGTWTVTGGCLAGCGGYNNGVVTCPGGPEGTICPDTCPSGWAQHPVNSCSAGAQARPVPTAVELSGMCSATASQTAVAPRPRPRPRPRPDDDSSTSTTNSSEAF